MPARRCATPAARLPRHGRTHRGPNMSGGPASVPYRGTLGARLGASYLYLALRSLARGANLPDPARAAQSYYYSTNKTHSRLQKHGPITNNPPGYPDGNCDTDSATWPEVGDQSNPVSPQPLPRFTTHAAPPAAAGPSSSANDGPPSSRTRSKTREQQ